MRRRSRPLLVSLLCVAAVLAAACSSADSPELVAVSSTPTAVPTAVEPAPSTPTSSPASTPTPVVTPAPTPTPVPALSRGISDSTITIAVVKTGSVFGDVEVGVRARVERANADTGIHGRTIEVVEVVNDRGDPDRLLNEVKRLVEEVQVFALVLATSVPTPAVTDYLADSAVPFFGWGFAPGFCDPNEWGFGFNGCQIGAVLDLPGSTVDISARELIDALADEPQQFMLVVSDDPSGVAAEASATEVWGERLTDVLVDDPDNPTAAAEAVVSASPEVVLLSVGLDRAIALKGDLQGVYGGLVVDDVAYLPGLLSDFSVADKLEGGYSVSQFPPQEEYREATAVFATDLQSIGADLIYSQAVSLGYWSSDLMLSLFGQVGANLDTATFHQQVNVVGVDYAPELDGSPCPMHSLEIHTSPAGGSAIVVVSGGIYFPAVAFTCF